MTYGVPYGARARMILLYLQTQAVRTGSREVALGRSMRDWMERMGLAVGGETARSLREQAARISACTLKFFWEDDDAEGWARGAIVTSGLRFKVPEDGQGSLWEDRVVLDEVFWKALRDHPVPLLEAAIRQLRDRSMSLDIYVWLAWRCHQLGKPTAISWPAIHAQFGARLQGDQALQAKLPRCPGGGHGGLSGGAGGSRGRGDHAAPGPPSRGPTIGGRLTPHPAIRTASPCGFATARCGPVRRDAPGACHGRAVPGTRGRR